MKKLFAAFALSIAAAFTPAAAATISYDQTLTASTDGTIFTCPGCGMLDTPALISNPILQSVIKFDTAGFNGPVDAATLSLTIFNTTFQAIWVDVYGYGSANTSISLADKDMGVLLGRINLPFALSEDQQFTLDVSEFVRNVKAPVAAFNLRSIGLPGSARFNSTRGNSGPAPELLLDLGAVVPADVPEPGQLALVFVALAAFGAARRAQRRG